MSHNPISILHVQYCPGNTIIPMGRLAYKNHKIFFEYEASFLQTGLRLSPFKLPLRPGVIACEDYVFDGLFGVFNDSLPDGWGRLLVDRKLMQLGIQPASMTPLDRLRFVGNRGMGALFYEPEIALANREYHDDLDNIHSKCLEIQQFSTDQHLDDVLHMSGSSCGARPKVLVTFTNSVFEASENTLKTEHNDWIVKFGASSDPADIGSIEYAYHLMAACAHLEVPEARLFASKHCSGYFGVKRFDRVGKKFYHMHSASGLLHADHRLPSLDYSTLMKATLWLTKDVFQCEKLFRHAVFNVLAYNRDDHAKNFSFIMDEHGRWYVSPAYDLTFCVGPLGEHCTTVMREGKNLTKQHLLQLAQVGGLAQEKALTILQEVKAAVSQWPKFAQEANVSKQSSSQIQAATKRVSEQF